VARLYAHSWAFRQREVLSLLLYVEKPTTKAEMPWKVSASRHVLDGFWMNAHAGRRFLTRQRPLDSRLQVRESRRIAWSRFAVLHSSQSELMIES